MKTLREYILEELDQVEIFARYMSISESDIRDSISFKVKVKSPFRDDPCASVSFKYYGSKLICRDFGDSHYRGDIFEIVGVIIGKDCRLTEEFVYICNHIVDTLHPTKKVVKKDQTSLITSPTEIVIQTRLFVPADYKYFYRYFIDRYAVNENYFPVKTYSVNGFHASYKYSASDPCYAYSNNPNRLKLYFPLRDKKNVRFISNNKIPIELIHTLRKTRFIILIKAFKDKLLMDAVCNSLGITDILFIPVASESARLPADIVALLKSYAHTIFTMFDMDRCGFESSFFYKEEYGFENIFMGKNYATKDPTDLVRVIKIEAFLKLFKTTYECF